MVATRLLPSSGGFAPVGTRQALLGGGRRVNLKYNSRFDAGTDGWVASGGTATISPQTDADFSNPTVMEIVATTVNHGAIETTARMSAIPAPDFYTVSCDVQLVAGTSDAWYISPLGYTSADVFIGGLTITSSGIFTPTAPVTRVSFVITATGATVGKIKLQMFKIANTGAATIHITNIVLERGSITSPTYTP